MDEGVIEKHIKRGNTVVNRSSIFKYLKNCKGSSRRSFTKVSPIVKKLYHYRAKDTKYEELCSEWEKNHKRCFEDIDSKYEKTESRFRRITNDYYSDELRKL